MLCRRVPPRRLQPKVRTLRTDLSDTPPVQQTASHGCFSRLCGCTGVACDVSIGSSNAIFKAKTFKALAAREPRFAGMLRLVKAWAGVFGLNDAAEGTFNSFALGLMVSRACQQRTGKLCRATLL